MEHNANITPILNQEPSLDAMKIKKSYYGSRNSCKGTKTGMIRSAFGDFVIEFNAKCLIFYKYGNSEPARAL